MRSVPYHNFSESLIYQSARKRAAVSLDIIFMFFLLDLLTTKYLFHSKHFFVLFFLFMLNDIFKVRYWSFKFNAFITLNACHSISRIKGSKCQLF